MWPNQQFDTLLETKKSQGSSTPSIGLEDLGRQLKWMALRREEKLLHNINRSQEFAGEGRRIIAKIYNQVHARVYSKMETTGDIQEQESQIRFCQKTFRKASRVMVSASSDR